jgi:hypothetical protein
MKRLAFIASLFGITVLGQTRKKKFYITGVYCTKEFNDCTLPPLEVYADSRINAIAATGLTVWTEEEFRSIVAGCGKPPLAPVRVPDADHPNCFGAGCPK